MPTVVDSLVIQLGFDVTALQAGQKKIEEDLKKTKENAATTAKSIEASGAQASRFFSKLRNEAMALFAVFLAGRGIKDFIMDITRGDAAVGRAAKALGMATDELAAWQQAAQRAGGSAEGITSSFQQMSAEFEKVQQTGQGGEQWRMVLQRLHINLRDDLGHAKTFSQIMKEVGQAFHGMDPRAATFYGSQLGFDQGTIQFLSTGSANIERLLSDARKRGVATDASSQRGIELQNSILDLQQTFEGLARELETDLVPIITHVMKLFEEWLQKPDTKQKILAIADSIGNLALGINEVVQYLGGWQTVSEAIFGIWAANKVATLVTSIATIGRALMLAFTNPALLAAMAAILAVSEIWAEHNANKTADEMGYDVNEVEGDYEFGGGSAKSYKNRKTGEVISREEMDKRIAASKAPKLPGAGGAGPSSSSGTTTPGQAYGGGKSAFYDHVHDFIKDEATRRGLPNPEVLAQLAAAQATIESTSGTSDLAVRANNWFGIRPGTPGGVGETGTSGSYVSFASTDDSMRGYLDFITKNPRYARSGVFDATNVTDAAQRLAGAGYAEDGRYASSITSTALRYGSGNGGPVSSDVARAMYPTPSVQDLLSGGRANDNSVALNTGDITIHTAATDARGIAGSLHASLDRQIVAAQANRGLA